MSRGYFSKFSWGMPPRANTSRSVPSFPYSDPTMQLSVGSDLHEDIYAHMHVREGVYVSSWDGPVWVSQYWLWGMACKDQEKHENEKYLIMTKCVMTEELNSTNCKHDLTAIKHELTDTKATCICILADTIKPFWSILRINWLILAISLLVHCSVLVHWKYYCT